MIGVRSKLEYLKFSLGLFHDFRFFLHGISAFEWQLNVLIREDLDETVVENNFIVFDFELDFGVVFLD